MTVACRRAVGRAVRAVLAAWWCGLVVLASGERCLGQTPAADLPEAPAEVVDLGFTPDGSALLVVTGDGELSKVDLAALGKDRQPVQPLALQPALGQSIGAAAILYLDNRRLIVGTRGDVQVWDWKQPQQTAAIGLAVSNDKLREQLAWSDDGSLVASVHFGGDAQPATTCVVTNAATGKAVAQIPLDPNRPPNGLAIGSGENALLAVSDERSITLYQVKTGKKRETINVGRTVRVEGFSHDGRFLCGQEGKANVFVWHLAEPGKSSRLAQQRRNSTVLAWSQINNAPVLYVEERQENNTLAVAVAYQTERPVEVHKTPPADALLWPRHNPLRDGINLGLQDGRSVVLWNAPQSAPRGGVALADFDLAAAAVSSDGKWLAVATNNRRLQLWGEGNLVPVLNTWKRIPTALTGGKLEFSGEGRHLTDGAKVVDVPSGRTVGQVTLRGTFLPSLMSFAAGDDEGKPEYSFINPVTGKKTLRRYALAGPQPAERHYQATAFGVSPDKKFLAIGVTIKDGDIEQHGLLVQETKNFKTVQSLAPGGLAFPAETLSISPDGRYIAVSTSSGNATKVFDAQSGEVLPVQIDERRFPLFLSDSKTLMCLAQDKVELWDPEAGQLKSSYEVTGGHRESALREVAVCVAKQFFATAAGDNVVLIRNLQTGRVIRLLWSPTMDVRAVAVTADGHWLAAAGDDATLLSELYAPSSAPAPAAAPTTPARSSSTARPRGTATPTGGLNTARRPVK